MNRVCPQCKKQLEETEYFFCSACGYKLDEELIVYSVPFTTRVTYFQESSSTGKKFSFSFPKIHEKILIALLLVLVVILSGIVIFHFTRIQEALNKSRGLSSPATSVNLPEPDPYNIETSLGIEEMDFSEVEMTKYVPYEVDFFVEGSDLLSSANQFEGISFDSSSPLFPYVGNLNGPYVLFGSLVNDTWKYALVASVSGVEEKTAQYTDTEENEDLEEEAITVTAFSDHIIYTNAPELVEEIEETSEGLAKNVSHRPEYSLAKNNLPKTGQVRFMSFNDNIDEIYSKITELTPGDDVLKFMDIVLNENMDKFVLTRK